MFPGWPPPAHTWPSADLVFDQLVPNKLWTSDGVGVWNASVPQNFAMEDARLSGTPRASASNSWWPMKSWWRRAASRFSPPGTGRSFM